MTLAPAREPGEVATSSSLRENGLAVTWATV